MKTGAWFLLVNATPWAFTHVSHHEYQMKDWEFPCTIAPGTSTRIYIKARDNLRHAADDGAEISYAIAGLQPSAPPMFEIRYHGKPRTGEPEIKVAFKTLGTLNNPAGSMLDLEWRQENNIPFILASSGSEVVSTNPPTDWMHATYNRISCLTLRELCVPGSHDAGMSEFHFGSGLASAPNTVTQDRNIGEQLKSGSRWFDIRPVIAGGAWTTGHYSFGVTSWHGGNGQNMNSIIDQVNAFTAANNELVILKFSEGFNTDTFKGDRGNRLTQREWRNLLTALLKIQNRVKGMGTTGDLSKLPVSRFISDSPAVIIVIDATAADGRGVDIGELADEGFFTGRQLPLFDSYANQREADKMIPDQIGKMKKQRTAADSEMFLLSWTLTQFAGEIVGPARDVNQVLAERLWPNLSNKTYPNILGVDAYPVNRDIAALSMAINYNFARTC